MAREERLKTTISVFGAVVIGLVVWGALLWLADITQAMAAVTLARY